MPVPPETDVPGYPSRWEADVVLADGGTVHVRPVRPDDADRIAAFHARQSPQSIYYRFFSPRPRLTPEDLERFTHVDYLDRMAFVAILDDELLGVARYDRWRGRAEAEVAFFIDDEHNGRGMATVLLEYLAVAAREVGLTGFTASVLPDNRKMLGVFRQAGFGVHSRFADGVIEVRLDLSPSEEAEAAVEERARRAAARAVLRLLSPESVAVIGASRQPGSAGHEIVRHLIHLGFNGPVHPVNPEAAHVASVRATASILDITDPIDLAIVAVPAELVPDVVEECGRKQVYAVIVVSSGFSETGEEGAALEARIVRIARTYGIRLLGPNCLGVINTDPNVRLHATFATPTARPGPVAVLSESGTLGAVVLEQAAAAGLGVSSFAAMGNRADVSGNDLLQYWQADDRTEVVLASIESFGNPRRFARIARSLARRKPLVTLKGGSVTGEGLPDETADAVLAQTGVIRVDTLAELVDVGRVLVGQPLPAGRRVGLVGNSGGALSLTAAACAGSGLVVDGVVDLGSDAAPETYAAAAGQLLASGADSLLVLFAPVLGDRAVAIGEAIGALATAWPAASVVAAFFGRHAPSIISGEHSIPVFDAPEAAATALGRVAAYASWLAEEEGKPPEVLVGEAARATVAAAVAGGGAWIDRDDAVAVLQGIGIEPVTTATVSSAEEAVAAADGIGYPVALKASGRGPLAKTEAAGLALDVHDGEELRAAYARMAERLGEAMQPAMVQPMADPGVDLAIGVRLHPFVGPVITLAPGGVAGKIDERHDLQVVPITDLDARRLVARSRHAAMLDDAGRETVERLVLAVGALADEVPEVAELVLDPVIVSGDVAAVADLRLRVEPVVADPTPNVRRLG